MTSAAGSTRDFEPSTRRFERATWKRFERQLRIPATSRTARCRWRSDRASSTRSITARSRSSARCWKLAPIRIQSIMRVFRRSSPRCRAAGRNPGRRVGPTSTTSFGCCCRSARTRISAASTTTRRSHMAVAERNAAAVGVLLSAGADASLPTRIDDCETPREMAESGRPARDCRSAPLV